ncbi:hypothetical protein X975_20713, partial [Stegodyphus mimosarum]
MSQTLDEKSAIDTSLTHENNSPQQRTDTTSSGSSTPAIELPSHITDKMYIFCYNESTVLADPKRTGKWLLYCNNKTKGYKGMTDLDRAWLKTVKLLKTTTLPIIRVKCSTAYAGEMKQRPEDPCGIIMFYTPDYTNKMEVRKVAEEISRNVRKSTLTYKTDEASRRGDYEHHGKKNICVYKFRDGKLLERSPNEQWVSVIEGCSDSLACGKSFRKWRQSS